MGEIKYIKWLNSQVVMEVIIRCLAQFQEKLVYSRVGPIYWLANIFEGHQYFGIGKLYICISTLFLVSATWISNKIAKYWQN